MLGTVLFSDFPDPFDVASNKHLLPARSYIKILRPKAIDIHFAHEIAMSNILPISINLADIAGLDMQNYLQNYKYLGSALLSMSTKNMV